MVARKLFHALVVLVLALALSPVRAEALAQVIVGYRASALGMDVGVAPWPAPETGQALRSAIGRRLDVQLQPGRWVGPHTQVLSARGMESADLAHRLSADPAVEYAVVDGRVRAQTAPGDPLYASVPLGDRTGGPEVGQWSLKPPTPATPSAIDAESAWARSTGRGVVVAVLDTGVLHEHPDLRGQVLPGWDFVSSTARANDGDGRDGDASDPGDWVTFSESQAGALAGCSPVASSWHGTKISALIAARTNDGYGMSGVAPNARILPVRVLGKCGGVDSDIIAGMRWAAGIEFDGLPGSEQPRARVLNLSLGGVGPCSAAYQQAVDEVIGRGVVVVVAAGNSAGQAVGTPANCKGVIAVGGLRHVGTKVGFSDLGPEIALSAPGGNCVNLESGAPCLYPLLTASNGSARAPDPALHRHTDAFDFTVGTSYATALASGTVALVLAADPALGPQDVQAILRSSARPFSLSRVEDGVMQCREPDAREQPPECLCTTALCGAGMLDARASVDNALAWTPANSQPVAGGGAMSLSWLLGLFAAGLWLRRR